MTVQPGDRLSAHVAVSGDTVTVSMSDLTRHASFSKQLTMSSPTVSSAEWIAEAPSRCRCWCRPGRMIAQAVSARPPGRHPPEVLPVTYCAAVAGSS
jgi:hypothetical protein